VINMSEITNIFHEFVDAWKDLQKAKADYEKYYISRAELIDYEMFEHDMESEFIEELKKYGDGCQNK
tara:strand:+ start:355 stop:555 length:201 start_codon:yes stop_codon:yes gene_type:complete